MSPRPHPSTPVLGTSTTHHTWFGREGRPLFGAVHVPEGRRATGAVVVCPPVGHEQTATQHGLRLLARELADRGLLVLRFDYHGTGHSSGNSSEATVEGWLEDVEEAVRYVRSAGTRRVGLVGLRLGALLAAHAYERVGAEELVLWDPVASGRRYLREEQARLRMTIGEVDQDPDRVALMGWSLPRTSVPALRRLGLPEVTERCVGIRTWAAIRPGGDGSLAELVRSLGGTVFDSVDSPDFVAPTEFVPVYPRRTLATLVDWYVTGREERGQVAVDPPIRTTAAVATAPDGHRVVERLRKIGPHGMFCVETTREGVEPPDADIEIVFHSTANDRCVGQGRMWPELAREFAAGGARCLRFDRRQIGESDCAANGTFTPLYCHENLEDIKLVDEDLVLPDGRRLHTGLSSGAWMSTKIALARPGTRLVALGPLMWSLEPRRVDESVLVDRGWDLEFGRAPVHESSPEPWKVTVKTLARTRMPYALWRALARTGRVGCPEDMLRALVEAGVDTTIVFPAGDRRVFELSRGSDALRAVGESARALDFRDLDGDLEDHVLLSLGYRNQTADVLRDVVAGMR